MSNLTPPQQTLFNRLSQKRQQGAELLEQSYLKGVTRSVIEKYSDQAHFVYELLQNADDVKATKVRFLLNDTGMRFAHNGTVHFSLTDPDTEEEDTKQHQLGHLNAITSIGNSNKYSSQMGKFGIGFKAVFQYVDTPEIYDPPFLFKIEKFLVPVLLEKDHPERQPEETLFNFPFAGSDRTISKSRQDILTKLTHLTYPLLFLRNLTEIHWVAQAGRQGRYAKSVTPVKLHSLGKRLKVERVCLTKEENRHLETQTLLVFSRLHVTNGETYQVSIAYLLASTGEILAEEQFPAYCFFPTEKPTHLRFLVHAPFLLTDSRESLKPGEDWNARLIEEIAQLTADSITIIKAMRLLTETFFSVLPTQANDFPEGHVFRPVYQAVLQRLQSEQESLLPTADGEFVVRRNAYLAEHHSLMNLLNHEQLGALVHNPQAKWIFPSLSNDSRLWKYVKESLTATHGTVTPSYVAVRIQNAFMKRQSDEWLMQLYSYLLEKSRYLWSESKRDILRNKPIIRLITEEMVAPYDPAGNLQVYLPTDHESDYPTVKQCLVENRQSLQFLTELGLQKPTGYEEVKYYVIPRYQKTEIVAHSVLLKDFRKLLTVFLACAWSQTEDYLNLIKGLPFCLARSGKDPQMSQRTPPEIYFHTPELALYFGHYEPVNWLETSFYKTCYDEFGKDSVTTFLHKLGVATTPRCLKVVATLTNVQRAEIHQGRCTRDYAQDRQQTYDYEMEGLTHCLTHLTKEKSKQVWNFLLNLMREPANQELFQGQYTWFYRKTRSHRFDAQFLTTLKQTSWLYDKQGQCRKSGEMVVFDLACEYDTESYAAKMLLAKLGIPTERLIGFTSEQKSKYAFGEEIFKLATELGQDPTEVFKQFQNFFTHTLHNGKISPVPETLATLPENRIDAVAKQRARLEGQQKQLEQQLGELGHLEVLQRQVNHFPKYTFAWFNTLLELEYLLSYENASRGKQISIQFGKVEKDPTSDRILILKYPSRHIPRSIEDLTDLSLQLCLKKETKSIFVEVVNVKEFTLRARLKSPAEIADIDLSKVQSAILDISNPTFILEHLKSAFRRLPLGEEDNLQILLPRQIEFVFGPPGTGKTTYLAKEKIVPLLKSSNSLKILVLTPTNKAADVLFRKIWEEMRNAGEEEMSRKWLIRFGITGDSDIERNGFLKDKSFELTTLATCVVVTTIARFIYDGFLGQKLKQVPWQIILFDEASMITLATIVYVLYQQPRSQFVVSGDPFQIQPLVIANSWQEENIYTLVGLNDFHGSQTVPHSFPITKLMTQYRSLPPLGELFSQFTYAGQLTHQRSLAEKKKLRMFGAELKEITVIKFPVSKFDSIYKPQRLDGGSAYQIYSAIFTVELTLYLAKEILKQHPTSWKIGVICPYLAQANLVEKIFYAMSVESPQVQVMTGTIHGFQGDECDIIVNLLNPPPAIGPDIFLNKLNILNVSISRARDYLILIVPDIIEELEQLNRLTDILRGEENIRSHCRWFRTEEIERAMFKKSNYIYENCFITTHQKVNVYSRPEKRYEVRCEENAIDVQVNNE